MTLLLWAFSLSRFEADMSDVILRARKREAEGRGLSCDWLGAGKILRELSLWNGDGQEVHILSNDPIPHPLDAAPRISTRLPREYIADPYILRRGRFVYSSVSVIQIVKHGVSAGFLELSSIWANASAATDMLLLSSNRSRQEQQV